TTAETIIMAEELRRMFQANDRYCAERLFSQFQDSRGMDCVEDKGNSGYPVPASPNEPFFLKEQRSDGSPGSPTINKSAGGRVINARQDVLKHMFSNAIGTDMIRLNPEGAETLQEQWQWDEKNSCFRQTVFFVSLSQGNNLSVVCGACSRVLS
nr:hypothetical protein [Endozoicomonas sp.]